MRVQIQKWGNSLALRIPKPFAEEANVRQGTVVSGVVLSDQIRSLDWRARDAQLICRFPGPALAEVMQKMAALLFEQET